MNESSVSPLSRVIPWLWIFCQLDFLL